MKLYDVIRKEDREKGTPLREIEIEPVVIHRQKSPRKPTFVFKKIIIISLVPLFLAFLYIAGMKVVRATVVVTQRQIPFTLDGAEFELDQETAGTTGRLSFQTMIVPAEVSRQVYGSQVEPSTSYAKGKVVFFNEYSTKAQTVKAKTKLTAADGKTYTTLENAVVPGYTIQNKVKTAGTSTATAIVATSIGPTYNTSGTSFVVSGWTGTKAKQFYAQSAGQVTGGEDGVAHSVSTADQADVIATLQAQLLERLKRETRAQIPDTLLAFPDLQAATISSDSITLKGASVKFPASIKGTMVTYLISREMLESAIANRVLSDHTYARVSIPTINDLTVIPVSQLPSDPKNTPDTILVKISGTGTIITKAPIETIRQSLVGKSKKGFESIFSEIPEISSAEYHFYPFWAPFFPQSPSRIKIDIQ